MYLTCGKLNAEQRIEEADRTLVKNVIHKFNSADCDIKALIMDGRKLLKLLAIVVLVLLLLNLIANWLTGAYVDAIKSQMPW